MKKKFSTLGALVVLTLAVASLGQPQPVNALKERCPPTGCYCTALQGWPCEEVGSYHDCRAVNEGPSWCICQVTGGVKRWNCQ